VQRAVLADGVAISDRIAVRLSREASYILYRRLGDFNLY
jgi:hypothetical protein